MKRTMITVAAVSAAMLLTSAVPAGEMGQAMYESQELAPATQPATENLPALPPGHPDMAAMRAAAQQQKAAQAGGDGSMPALPQGHPNIGNAAGAAGAGRLPSGHPDIGSMTPGPAGDASPATQPAMGGFASLTVQAEQGTVGGPAIGADDIRLEVYDVHANKVAAKVEGKLTETGSVRIGGLPVGPAYQPVVTITHAGVEYQAMGAPIDSADGKLMAVRVYESTDQNPGWEIRMRHIMIQASADGVQVMEMLAVDNASDKAFLGTATTDGSKVSFELPLPAGAKDVQLVQGFHDCCAKVTDGKIINSMAIVPGTTQYQFTYTVPSVSGKAELLSVAPATTKHLMIFAPDDGTTIVASGGGVETGTTNMGGKNVRFYKGINVPAGSEVKLTVSGTPAKAAAAPGGTAAAPVSPLASVDAAQFMKVATGIGALFIAVFGAAFLFKKPSTKAQA